jgi:hypothetical protein
VGDECDLAQAGRDGRPGVLEVRDEGGPADLRGVRVARADPEVLPEVERGHRELGGGGEEPIHVGGREAALGERAL